MYFTWLRGLLFFPIIDDVIPSDVVSNSMQGGHLRLFGAYHESSMLEGHNISFHRLPSFHEFACGWRSYKCNSVWSEMKEGGG